MPVDVKLAQYVCEMVREPEFMKYRERKTSTDSESDSIASTITNSVESDVTATTVAYNSDLEVARQGSPAYILDYDLYEEEDISLVSNTVIDDENVAVLGNNNQSNEAAIDNSTEDSFYPKIVEADLSSKDLLKIALDLDQSFERCGSNFPPMKVPHKKGNYLAVIPGSNVKNISDIFGADMVSPWNSKSSRAKQYYVNYEVQDEEVVKYERTKAEEKDNFSTYCFEFQARHPVYKSLTKKIIGVVQPQNKKPIESSYVVIYYSLTEDCEAIQSCCSKETFAPRLCASNSADIRALTKNKTPRNAIIAQNETNSIMNGIYPIVTEKQAQNVAGRDKLREAPTNKAQITSAGMCFVQHTPVSLRDKALFMGIEKWRRLSVDAKKRLFLRVGLSHTDIIKGFTIAPTSFPSRLSPNLSEAQRERMVNSAKSMEVLKSAANGTYVVMTSTFPITVSAKDKIQCSCKYREKHWLICEHLLAVHFKYPVLQILEKLQSELDSETMTEKHIRSTDVNSGKKPGSNRRGPSTSRNTKKIVHEIRDCESLSNNTSTTTLNRLGAASLQPCTATISTYNAEKQLENRPHAVAQRPETFHRPTAEALKNYKIAYDITPAETELWYNANAFMLKYTKKVSNAFNRECCHCRMNISKTQKIVFTHLEKYEFIMKSNNQVRVGYGERIICAKFGCFISRYPYAQQDCILSEVTEEEAEEIISNIFAP
uniref:SWIM-type domain-containing protein n=1 Tax=Panagrolaimus sp. PS1159 TaxID=55785 RepID=A0AC35GCD9_9BILA